LLFIRRSKNDFDKNLWQSIKRNRNENKGFNRKNDLILIGPVGLKQFFEDSINLNKDGEQ
jgi:hypothetical protein